MSSITVLLVPFNFAGKHKYARVLRFPARLNSASQTVMRQVRQSIVVHTVQYCFVDHNPRPPYINC